MMVEVRNTWLNIRSLQFISFQWVEYEISVVRLSGAVKAVTEIVTGVHELEDVL